MKDEKRLIEDYLPIQAISAEASREKSIRKGHISTLHLWWARRPLVACRAAVYGALVPATQFVPENGPDNKKQSLGRANAAKFVTELCKYPGNPVTIKRAQEHILDAHAERLTIELSEAKKTNIFPGWVEEFKWDKDKTTVTSEDIEAGRAPRPRVLDMFAGGGAIPLEALRLGCDAYALDLNPVAHIIELCTLVYPQKYGKPDPNSPGMTGPRGKDGKPTWGGLAKEVRYWGEWVLEKVKAQIGDLYPPIPDPESPRTRRELGSQQIEMSGKGFKKTGQQTLAIEKSSGYLTPVAYLWTRTVRCKNPSCGATVPLVRQTWLCKKKSGKKSPGRYVALKVVAPEGEKKVRFEVVESTTEKGLGFDPAAFSKGGNATCPFCGTVADSNYVKAEGCAKRISQQLMAIVCTRTGKKGKVYLSADNYWEFIPDNEMIQTKINYLCKKTGRTLPCEQVPRLDSFTCKTHLYGLTKWSDLFTNRQMLSLLSFSAAIIDSEQEIRKKYKDDITIAIVMFLGSVLDRLADFNSSLCVFNYTGGRGVVHTFGRQALPMVLCCFR